LGPPTFIRLQMTTSAGHVAREIEDHRAAAVIGVRNRADGSPTGGTGPILDGLPRCANVRADETNGSGRSGRSALRIWRWRWLCRAVPSPHATQHQVTTHQLWGGGVYVYNRNNPASSPRTASRSPHPRGQAHPHPDGEPRLRHHRTRRQRCRCPAGQHQHRHAQLYHRLPLTSAQTNRPQLVVGSIHARSARPPSVS